MKLKTEVTLSAPEVAKAIQAYMKNGGWEIKGPINFTTKTVSSDDMRDDSSWEEFDGCKFTVEDWEGPGIKKLSIK